MPEPKPTINIGKVIFPTLPSNEQRTIPVKADIKHKILISILLCFFILFSMFPIYSYGSEEMVIGLEEHEEDSLIGDLNSFDNPDNSEIINNPDSLDNSINSEIPINSLDMSNSDLETEESTTSSSLTFEEPVNYFETLYYSDNLDDMYSNLLNFLNIDSSFTLSDYELQSLYDKVVLMNEYEDYEYFEDLIDTLQYIAGNYELNNAQILADWNGQTSGSYVLNGIVTISNEIVIPANSTLEIKGRHDPCIVPRAIVVVEAMAALGILDMIGYQ